MAPVPSLATHSFQDGESRPTTEDYSRMHIQSRQHEIQNIPSDIVKEYVQVPHSLLEILQKCWTLVVEGLLDTNLLF